MAINSGKRFENNFKESVPSDVFLYRFKDGTANWKGGSNSNVRFQAKNICDYMLYNGENLFLLELKSHKGKSLPLNCIRDNQIEELQKASLYEGIVAGLLVQFQDFDKVFFLSIDKLTYFLSTETSKSISYKFFKEQGLEIPCTKKRTNITLNLKKLLKKC